MPRKSRPASSKGAGPTGSAKSDFGVTFVNIYLTDADKKALSEYDAGSIDPWSEIERLVDNGYKVSIREDINNACVIFSITGSDVCHVPENVGFCLVSRAKSPFTALVVCLYKLQVYCIDGVFPHRVSRDEIDFE